MEVYEVAFSSALTAIAMGETRDVTRNDLLESYSALEADVASDVLADALTEALAQGVEREDIDESWF